MWMKMKFGFVRSCSHCVIFLLILSRNIFSPQEVLTWSSWNDPCAQILVVASDVSLIANTGEKWWPGEALESEICPGGRGWLFSEALHHVCWRCSYCVLKEGNLSLIKFLSSCKEVYNTFWCCNIFVYRGHQSSRLLDGQLWASYTAIEAVFV